MMRAVRPVRKGVDTPIAREQRFQFSSTLALHSFNPKPHRMSLGDPSLASIGLKECTVAMNFSRILAIGTQNMISSDSISYLFQLAHTERWREGPN